MLNASLPIDLNLDRLVLPVIVLTWVVALAAGGPGAPRWRFTPIHAALAAFALVAGLSVVLNAGALDRTLVLDLSVKKLTLLLAYLSFFVVVASAVRPAEVPAFLKLHARARGDLRGGRDLGIPNWIQRLLRRSRRERCPASSKRRSMPRVSTSSDAARSSARPSLARGGRRSSSMAFPIAIVGIIHAKRWGGRILYGLAACSSAGDALDLPQERACSPR